MEILIELFKHSDPLAWVIGAITMIALALVMRSSKLFSENKTFFVVVLVIGLITALYVAKLAFPPAKVPITTGTATMVDTPKPVVNTANGSASPIVKPSKPKERTETITPSKPVIKSEFIGIWKNTAANSSRFQRLEFTVEADKLRVRITGVSDANVGQFIPVSKDKNHLFIKEIIYEELNHYTNMDFKIKDNGLLDLNYHLKLRNGYVDDVVDHFSK